MRQSSWEKKENSSVTNENKSIKRVSMVKQVLELWEKKSMSSVPNVKIRKETRANTVCVENVAKIRYLQKWLNAKVNIN